MDSSIAEGFGNTDNVSDVNKQLSYPHNPIDYPQNNYTADTEVISDSFHAEGDPYIVQSESMYNAPQPDQHISFQQGDQNLENITHQTYYPTQESQLQNSYIPEPSQIEGPAIIQTNNGINEEQIESIQTEHPVDNSEVLNEKEILKVKEETMIISTELPAAENAALIVLPIESSVDNSVEKENSQEVQISSEPEVTDSVELIVSGNVESIDATQESSENVIVKEELVSAPKADNNVEHLNLKPLQETQEEQVEETTVAVGEITDLVEETTNLVEETTVLVEETTDLVEETTDLVEETADTVGKTTNLVKETIDLVQETTDTVEAAEPLENVDYIELKNYEEVPVEQDKVEYVEESKSADSSSEQASQNVEAEIIEKVASEEEKKPKQRRTRKCFHDLPMHLIGHDISKPVESIPNGRALPKPRLGVKVPYLTLTSQIVSKAELEEEVLERARAKELSSGKNEKFVRSLTHRLANKIAPEKGKKNKKAKDNSEDGAKTIETAAREKEQVVVQKEVKSSQSSINSKGTIDDSKIENDDDLLAILEGEGEEIPLMTKESQDTQLDDISLKSLEREIALQQLHELPHQGPKERILKPRFVKSLNPKLDLSTKLKSSISKLAPQKPPVSVKLENSLKKIDLLPKKSPVDSPKKISIDLDVPAQTKKTVEMEPQVKVNMVLKTYSRKRKPSDVPDFEMSPPKRSAFEDPDANDIYEKGDPLALPTDVYVTKSSRVIKKKVIWDPDDEQSPRLTKTTPGKTQEKVSPVKVVKATPDKSEKSEKKASGTSTEKVKPEVKIVEKNQVEKVVPKKIIVKNKSTAKPKRGMSEVDRLLMDEGAIKMLYDLKTTDSATKKKKTVYSVEKAEKEILKKANLLKNDLVQNTESPKSLRKKEGLAAVTPPAKHPTPILERKMSKDSTRSSVHTPPRSPTFFSSQASMLIRRRSSSSMSSDDMEGEDFSPKAGKSSKKSESKAKRQKRNPNSEKQNTAESKESKEIEKPAKEITPKGAKGAHYKSFTVRKSDKHVSIDLNYIDDKCHLTIPVLEELIIALKKLEKDKDCNVVSVTSTSKSFCLGLDYTSLVSDDKTERIEKATHLAKNVREFLLCLLHFPKVLVAGILGKCVGLGVTMLSLFDMVIASDSATFSTPYSCLGCLGEATFLLTYPNLDSSGLAAELLYANQTLKADEAFRRGLISKLCWPEKYEDTLNNFLTSVAGGSRQSLETTKRQLRANLTHQIEAAINDEVDILIQHWTSPECQQKFSELGK